MTSPYPWVQSNLDLLARVTGGAITAQAPTPGQYAAHLNRQGDFLAGIKAWEYGWDYYTYDVNKKVSGAIPGINAAGFGLDNAFTGFGSGLNNALTGFGNFLTGAGQGAQLLGLGGGILQTVLAVGVGYLIYKEVRK